PRRDRRRPGRFEGEVGPEEGAAPDGGRGATRSDGVEVLEPRVSVERKRTFAGTGGMKTHTRKDRSSMTYTEKRSPHSTYMAAPLDSLRATIAGFLILYLSHKWRRGESSSAVDTAIRKETYATLSCLLELWRIRTGEFIFRVGVHLIEIESGPEPG